MSFFENRGVWHKNIDPCDVHTTTREDMESFAFRDRINLISTEIKQKCSKL